MPVYPKNSIGDTWKAFTAHQFSVNHELLCKNDCSHSDVCGDMSHEGCDCGLHMCAHPGRIFAFEHVCTATEVAAIFFTGNGGSEIGSDKIIFASGLFVYLGDQGMDMPCSHTALQLETGSCSPRIPVRVGEPGNHWDVCSSPPL